MVNEQDIPREPVEPEDRAKAEQIRELITEGYTLEQIVKTFGFNYKTAWQEMRIPTAKADEPDQPRSGPANRGILPCAVGSGENAQPGGQNTHQRRG